MSLLTVHIIAAGAWLGLVAGESVMELSVRDDAARRVIARIHKWIDILFEGPLVATVLVTGAVLLSRVWPPSPLLMVKVSAAMIGIIANLFCMPWVLARARAGSATAINSYSRKIAATGAGIPFALLALAIGLYGV